MHPIKLVFCLLTLTPALAFAAEEPQCDPECDANTVCEAIYEMDCAVSSEDSGGEDDDCEESVSEYACVPKPCGEEEGACEGDWSCTEIVFECEDGEPSISVSCDPDEEGCAMPDDGDDDDDCEDEIMNFCLPPWFGECESAADCGAHFTCEAREECSCDDSPPSSDTSGGGSSSDALSEDDDGCTCTESDEKRCIPEEMSCEDDSSCPDEWGCAEAPSPPLACTVDPDGEEECEEAPPPDGPSYCRPELWDLLIDEDDDDYHGHDDEHHDDGSHTGSQDGPEQDGQDDTDNEAAGESAMGEENPEPDNSTVNLFEGCRGVPATLLSLLLGLGLLRRRRRD